MTRRLPQLLPLLLSISALARKREVFSEFLSWKLWVHRTWLVNLGFVLCYQSLSRFCLTLCDPMDCSMRGSSVLHCLPEFTQTHVHWVGDAIQPSSAASFPFAFNLYQHQIIFASGGQSIGTSASALVLSMSIQDWFPRLTGLISLQSKGLSKVFSRTTVWKYQFFSAQPSLWSSSHIHTWLPDKP